MHICRYGILLLSILVSCNPGINKSSVNDDGISVMSVDSLRKNISVLASDSFLGRKPFTAGETLTIGYLQKQFAAVGLEAANGNSYLQEVPMVNIVSTPAPVMEVRSPTGTFDLKGLDDYVIWTDKDESAGFNNNELIFAGYGVVAPEYNRNDYAGLDVKNKIVLIKVNDPGFDTNDTILFKGKTMTYYGRWTYKFEEAAKQGAKGCLIIHDTKAASYPFSVVQNNWKAAKLRLDTRGKNIPYCDIVGWVSTDAAVKLLKAAGRDSSLLATASDPGFRSVPLGIQLTTKIEVTATYNKTYNVIGKITGSKRPDEVVIYTAHWDHLGIGKPDATGDSIYNGASDNASGTAALIELARAFKAMKMPPERTIVMLAVTAEEQGLWGSAYYAQNPLYPVAKTVANINMDGVNRFGKTNDYIVIGQGQSELEDYIREEAVKMGRYISYDLHPEAGSYFRSDHFNFAKVGVPALYAKSGVDFIGKGKAYGEKLKEEYTTNHYHRPSDEIDSSWTYEGGIEELKLLFLVGKRVSFTGINPTWKAGSEFRVIREGKK